MKRGWTISSLCASALVVGAIGVTLAGIGLLTASLAVPLGAAAQDDAGRRVNETTLAGLRPGHDKLAAALSATESKYLNEQNGNAEKVWSDGCTGRSLRMELDAHAEIESITVSSLGEDLGKCDQARIDELDMKSWVTGHGLRLGDPEDRAIQLYGEANSTGPSVKGEKELEFLYYQFDWAGSDVPQVLEIYCARDTGRIVEMTLAYPSL